MGALGVVRGERRAVRSNIIVHEIVALILTQDHLEATTDHHEDQVNHNRIRKLVDGARAPHAEGISPEVHVVELQLSAYLEDNFHMKSARR